MLNNKFYYQVSYRVNPICGKRKYKIFALLYEANNFLLQMANDDLNPILTVKRIKV